MGRPEKFNYETTLSSIRKFLEAHTVPKGKKYVPVMDNAPWHKKAMRLAGEEHAEEYADIFASVTFVNLPPYSPDLNLIEQVWRITRRENTHNMFFPTLAALKDAVGRAFHAWAVPNVQLKPLCSFG